MVPLIRFLSGVPFPGNLVVPTRIVSGKDIKYMLPPVPATGKNIAKSQQKKSIDNGENKNPAQVFPETGFFCMKCRIDQCGNLVNAG